jgi:phosphoglycolate phosphatase-like HAD superfamily hydrolase
MSFDISVYKTFVFDCDGVVLNSNKVKTEAFYQASLLYGKQAAQAMVDYHVANGGVSRYKKFAHFLENIVPRQEGPDLDSLLASYASHVKDGLLSCEVAPGLQTLRESTPEARWLIVSGGDQAELRDVFAHRGLTQLFDGGIFGSPDTKDEILQRELASSNVQYPALFLGDSKYDYQAAHRAKIDFVFISTWTEVANWKNWCIAENIFTLKELSSMTLLDNLDTEGVRC